MLVFGLCIFVCTGCANVRRFKGVDWREPSIVLAGVPAVRQTRDLSCGPACVGATALYWLKNSANPSPLEKLPYDAQDRSALELCGIAESLGMVGYAFDATMTDLAVHLRKGWPTIVMIRKHLVEAPFWLPGANVGIWVASRIVPIRHWVIVIGLIDDKWVVVKDPDVGEYSIKQSLFIKEWKKNGNICVLILPKSDQPSSVKIEERAVPDASASE
jgi:predicted double-glycine peptidase